MSQKKQAMYANDRDGFALSLMSKAALVDIATEALRMLAGECDTELTVAQVVNHEIVSSVLQRRGDKHGRKLLNEMYELRCAIGDYSHQSSSGEFDNWDTQ